MSSAYIRIGNYSTYSTANLSIDIVSNRLSSIIKVALSVIVVEFKFVTDNI